MVYKDGSGGSNRVYAQNTVSGTTQKYIRPLYYDYTLTKDIGSPPADPKKVYTLKADSGGHTLYFDGGGKLRRVEDRNSNYLSYVYDTDATNIADANGKLTTITDVAGRQTSFEYAGTPTRLSKSTDMAGRVSTYTYDSSGNLTTIKHGVDPVTGAALQTNTLSYGIAHHLIGVTNPRGYKSYLEYRIEDRWDSAGNDEGFTPEWQGTAVAQSTAHAFRGSGSLKLDMSNLTDTTLGIAAKASTTPMTWNSTQGELDGYVWTHTGSRLNARLMLRDSRNVQVYGPWWPTTPGVWTSIRMPSANVDAGYRIEKVSVQLQAQAGTPPFTGSVWIDHLLVKGVVDYLTDAKSTATTTESFGYDWVNSTTTVSRPDTGGALRSVSLTYNLFGQVERHIDLANITTVTQYDEFLRLTTVTPPGSGNYSYSYYPNSNELQTYTGPLGTTERQGVDTDTGDVRYEIDERNEDRRADNLDYVASVYVYDGTGHLTSEQTNRYDAGTDLETPVSQNAPLPAPQATLHKTDYTYGAGGVVTSTTDAKGNVTNYTYDSLKGYLTQLDAPAGSGESSRRVTTIVPNTDGSPTYIIDPKAQKTTYEYDGLGRLTKTTYGMQDGVADFSTSYTYDANGNRTAMTDKAGSSTWTYNESDQLTGESRTQNGMTKSASYTYYPNGAPSSKQTLNGQTTSYSYDAAGNIVSQTDPNDGGGAIQYTNDNMGQPTGITFPSGVKKNLSYDVAGNVSQISLTTAGGLALQSYSYDYGLNADGTLGPSYWNGYVRSVTEQDGSKTSYDYDDLGRLVSATRTGTNPYTQSYTYDSNDNRTSVTTDGITSTATYDAANQLTSQGGTSYGYDRNGNLIGYDMNTLSYDASNRWTGGTMGGQSMAFGYDGQGRRASRTVGSVRADYWYDSTGLSLRRAQQTPPTCVIRGESPSQSAAVAPSTIMRRTA